MDRLIPSLIALLAVLLVLSLSLFTVDQPFEFPAVEEDPSTVAAVVNGDTAAFVLAHGAMALWADDFGHKNTVRHSATGRKSTGVSPPRPSDAVVSLDPVQALREWGAAQPNSM